MKRGLQTRRFAAVLGCRAVSLLLAGMTDLAIAALILAGGQSSRFGRDKALAKWQGTPLLARVARTARALTPQVAVLTPWPERYRPGLDETTLWLPEAQPGQGALVALADGLGQLAAQQSLDWVLALACDLPCLQGAVLRTWRDRLAALPLDQLALVPRVGDRWEPLCAFYRPAVLSHLQAFQDQDGRTFQRWLATLPIAALDLDPDAAAMLWNCNTAADLPPRRAR